MKHRKFLTILLSLAIMVTFMPMMAFAATAPDGGVWNSDFTSVDIKSDGVTKTYTNISKVWSDGTGLVTATVDWTGYQTPGPVSTIDYLDLNTAEITGYKNVSYETFNTTYGYDKEKKTLASGYGITLSKPSYITGTNTNKYTFKNGDKNAKVEFTVEGFDPDNKYEDQPVTVTARFVPYDVTADMVVIEPTAPITKSVTVTAAKAVATDVKFTVDKVKGAGVGDTAYDGKTHKIVNNDVKGFTVEYFVLNDTTKKYDKVDAIEYKDAGAVHGKAVVTETATKKETATYFDFIVGGCNDTIWFEFDESSEKKTDYARVYSVPENADPMDYVVVDGVYKADEEEAMKYFADRYEITATPDKADASIVKWTMKEKEGVDKAALNKTYATFFKNYPYAKDDAHASDSMKVLLAKETVVDKDDDITFSGVTTKAFKAKKKTKKLAKTKSFQITAVADSGNEIKFSGTTPDGKITVSVDGKVTVKKGLKKGTYKVTVKAKTAAGNGYKAAKETNVYTIKIK